MARGSWDWTSYSSGCGAVWSLFAQSRDVTRAKIIREFAAPWWTTICACSYVGCNERVDRRGWETELEEGLNQRGLAGYQRGQIRWCAPVEAETWSAQLLVNDLFVRTFSTRCSITFSVCSQFVPRYWNLMFLFDSWKEHRTIISVYLITVEGISSNSRVCVYLWNTSKGTNELQGTGRSKVQPLERKLDVEESEVMTKVRRYRFLSLLVHILLGGKFHWKHYSSIRIFRCPNCPRSKWERNYSSPLSLSANLSWPDDLRNMFVIATRTIFRP